MFFYTTFSIHIFSIQNFLYNTLFFYTTWPESLSDSDLLFYLVFLHIIVHDRRPFFSIQHLSRHIFLYSFFYTLLSIHIFSIQHVFFYTTFSIHIFSIHNFLYNTFFSIQFCLYTFCLYTLSIQHNFFYTIRPGPFLLVEARAGGEGGVSQEFTIN